VTPRRIGILAFEGVDLLDLGGPYEVFLTASRLAVRAGSPSPFEVVVIGAEPGPIHAYGGLALVPHVAAEAVDRLDVLIVPGAIAIEDVAADPATARAVRRLLGVADLPASVCTGAFLLADAGVLADRPWTTHWEDVPMLATRLGSTRGRTGVAWVDADDVVTSGGLSSGIAMALHLVDRLQDRDLAQRTARQLDYAWEAKPG
jgi:transcriptional regulator GlxA family with amidase domain